MAYRRDVDDEAPPQPIDEPLKVDVSTRAIALEPALLDRLWLDSEVSSWGLARGDFERIILVAGLRQNFGVAAGTAASLGEQAEFFRSIKLADLVLASACAEGNECAWEHFMSAYGAQLTRAAIAISGSQTVGRDLADAFYAELYGLNTRDGKRKCPLESYRGRGSLLGWLRTTLSQRFVDHYRRTYREEELDEGRHDSPIDEGSSLPDSATGTALREAVHQALTSQPAEERFVLAAYYLDERTLAEIGKFLNVHEATISRRLKRSTEAIRKQILKLLEKGGLSRTAAQEAIGTDPRDLELGMDLKKLLQYPSSESFKEQVPSQPAVESGTVAGAMLSDISASRAGEANSER
ncbi:MAG: sigma-70 family RNA polymerase sigma factor [Acidobacteria bacterium]|nr:sigma-70 family RNA polymerase sigma factor [Acidobacteriota bacterium]